MLSIVISGLVGSMCGVVSFVTLCLCKAGSDADDEMERYMERRGTQDGGEDGSKN